MIRFSSVLILLAAACAPPERRASDAGWNGTYRCPAPTTTTGDPAAWSGEFKSAFVLQVTDAALAIGNLGCPRWSDAGVIGCGPTSFSGDGPDASCDWRLWMELSGAWIDGGRVLSLQQEADCILPDGGWDRVEGVALCRLP